MVVFQYKAICLRPANLVFSVDRRVYAHLSTSVRAHFSRPRQPLSPTPWRALYLL